MATPSLSSVYLPLRLVYGLVPIVAGLDKFFNLLTHWDKYMAPGAAALLPVSVPTFMMIVGVIEIVAGLVTLTFLTRLGAYVVMLWLVLIAINLIMAGFYDIAVRDLVMAVGAFCLGQVAAIRGDRWLPIGSRSQGLQAHAITN
jgi:uncharacterized membrane protein YphA (DoxX/SURF4 family)